MTGRERTSWIIRKALDESGLTDSEVARRCGMDRTDICRLAKGCFDARLGTILRVLHGCGFEFVNFRVRKVGANPNKSQIVDKAKAKA